MTSCGTPSAGRADLVEAVRPARAVRVTSSAAEVVVELGDVARADDRDERGRRARVAVAQPGHRDLRRRRRRARRRSRSTSSTMRGLLRRSPRCARAASSPSAGRRRCGGTCRSAARRRAATTASTPSPSASAIGSSSRSAVRSTRLYSTWMPAIGDQPRSSAIVCARATPPGREVRQARVDDLAARDEVVEPAQDLLDRRHAVLEVDPVEVDAVGLEPLQAALDRPDHVLAAVAGLTRGCRPLLYLVATTKWSRSAARKSPSSVSDSPSW